MATKIARTAASPASSNGVASTTAGLLFSFPIKDLLLTFVEQRELLIAFLGLLAVLLVGARELVTAWSLADRKISSFESFNISIFEFLKIILFFSVVQLLASWAFELFMNATVLLPCLVLMAAVALMAALNFVPYLSDKIFSASLSAADMLEDDDDDVADTDTE